MSETYDRYDLAVVFGGCPECGGNDGCRNAGSNHWSFCEQHRNKWYAGSDLFTSWREETPSEQREAFALIENYHTVDPIYPLLELGPARDEAFESFTAGDRHMRHTLSYPLRAIGAIKGGKRVAEWLIA